MHNTFEVTPGNVVVEDQTTESRTVELTVCCNNAEAEPLTNLFEDRVPFLLDEPDKFVSRLNVRTEFAKTGAHG
jgi:hypothetical protein